ncbi:MAG: 1,4-dihydroxy-6-naphthoate synthase [Rikenellaceae bacterium]
MILSISPCPNDTFMFDAIVNKKIDLRGYNFDCTFSDIDLLNQYAKESTADISKVSCAVAAQIMDSYNILQSGAALGHGNAPLLVSKRKIYPDEVKYCKVAIPGFDTTATLLLKDNFGEVKELRTYLFSDIMEAIHSDEVDAGVLIHEERFSYRDKSLQLIADLAQKWNSESKLPIPLGAIVVRNSLDMEVQRDISSIIAESVAYAFANKKESWNFIKSHSQSLSDSVIESHIEMFVNNYSLNLGVKGREAIERLFKIGGYDEISNISFV